MGGSFVPHTIAGSPPPPPALSSAGRMASVEDHLDKPVLLASASFGNGKGSSDGSAVVVQSGSQSFGASMTVSWEVAQAPAGSKGARVVAPPAPQLGKLVSGGTTTSAEAFNFGPPQPLPA